MDDDHAELSGLLPVLPILVELGASRHVTATAHALGLPQSTVSRALSRAAAVVGTPLLLRRGRGVELTPAALALIPKAAEALDAVRTGLALARQESGKSFGRIRVAFQHTFGEAALPLLIRAFASDNPGVTFDLQQGSRQFCLDLLESGTADLALVAPPPVPNSVIGAEVLYSEPLKLVVPEGHRLAGSAGTRLDAVRDEGFVMLEPGYGMRSIVEALCHSAGFRPRVAFLGQDLHTIRGLVSAGLGVAVAPPARVSLPAPHGSVLGWREVDITWPAARRDIGLVWRNRPDGPAQAARFRDMVLAGGRELLGGADRQ
ncbi:MULTISPECIES: LysR family transcriptional regulator [unclassified Arthrobacter]|uniref:LysR family transcriptional regulator n=1 Tax=unclassified Arthrobacter TaxID=235627 RepID=UPI00159E9BDA|nr:MULTISPECIES: LysR family transcriptional regulator [unclassified Arthrobacter]MCQ9165835.1 LysR family transcriptional regulator [Arthrobacter sp. STN4]NVM99728.1 LysR family transcriptional regulator [Arthrobacter sp. SDTb3-6]